MRRSVHSLDSLLSRSTALLRGARPHLALPQWGRRTIFHPTACHRRLVSHRRLGASRWPGSWTKRRVCPVPEGSLRGLRKPTRPPLPERYRPPAQRPVPLAPIRPEVVVGFLAAQVRLAMRFSVALACLPAAPHPAAGAFLAALHPAEALHPVAPQMLPGRRLRSQTAVAVPTGLLLLPRTGPRGGRRNRG